MKAIFHSIEIIFQVIIIKKPTMLMLFVLKINLKHCLKKKINLSGFFLLQLHMFINLQKHLLKKIFPRKDDFTLIFEISHEKKILNPCLWP